MSAPATASADAAAACAAADLGFLFDANRCTGCAACSLACSTENGLGWGESWRHIVSFNPERRPGVPAFHLSLACNHCEDAPCLHACPTAAIDRDPAAGAVLVDEARCMGCLYCAWVCPYDAPRFDPDRGVMCKCTSCDHRLRAGAIPACAEACPTGALGYGDLAGAERFPGFPDTTARPRIRFATLSRATPPESTWTLPAEVAAAFAPAPGGGARLLEPPLPSLGAEWPLWFFTSGIATLVGWVGAAALSVSGIGSSAIRVPLPAFLLVAAALLGAGALHLGRPRRAWRALANVRGSALSREIGAVGAFLGATVVWLAWGGAVNALGGAAAVLGLAALAAVDRVYVPVRRRPRVHSADTLLTGPLLAAALLRLPWLFGALAALKLTAAAASAPRRNVTWAARVAMRLAALAGPLALWSLAPRSWNGWTLLLVGAAELTDRARFYRELSIPGAATVRQPPQPPRPERRKRLFTTLLKIDPN